MTNGTNGQQYVRKEELHGEPCGNCGALALKVLLTHAFNPAAPGLLRAVNPSNPNQVEVELHGVNGYALCYNCTRTEYWSPNPENRHEWQKEVTYQGRNSFVEADQC